MNELNTSVQGLCLQDMVKEYVRYYFDLHGEILPAEGLYHRFLIEIERPLIEETLRRLKGNQVQVAKLLGMNRNTLRRKIQDLNISLESLWNEA